MRHHPYQHNKAKPKSIPSLPTLPTTPTSATALQTQQKLLHRWIIFPPNQPTHSNSLNNTYRQNHPSQQHEGESCSLPTNPTHNNKPNTTPTMSSNVPSVEDLINAFPTTITPITGEPNYASPKNLKDQHKANSASIPTTLGGGNHSYLGLILSPSAYVTITATPFQGPNYPGQYPTIPAGTNAANTSAIICHHTEDLRQWRECKNVITALKNQLLSAIDNIYVRALKDCHVGYMNKPNHAILHDLFENYGNITPLELEDNDTKMRSKWGPQQSL